MSDRSEPAKQSNFMQTTDVISAMEPKDQDRCEAVTSISKKIFTAEPKTVESESQTDAVVITNHAGTAIYDEPHSDVVDFSKPIQPMPFICGAGGNKLRMDALTPSARSAFVPLKVASSSASNMNDGDLSQFIDEPEVSLVQIHDKLISHKSLEEARLGVLDPNSGDNYVNVPLADSESEEDDELKPLMTDIYGHNECCMKQSDTKDSISSNESDCSFNYERRNSTTHQEGDSSEAHLSDGNGRDYRHSLKNINNTVEVKEIDSLSPSETPDEQMCEELVEQVEFYFSNENILKDAFLLKHVRRNKEGFVSLKLVSSFKRVRQLTKDWRVVGYAIRRKSRRIELNDLGTKIRRIEPLPSFDETMPSRTIVACDLPVDKLNIERVSDFFSKCGEIALIRILRPGQPIPSDVRQFINKYPEMQEKECALVEFTESQFARNAQNLNGNWKIYEMVAPKKKTGKKAVTVTKLIENYYDNNSHERSRGGAPASLTETDYKFRMRRNNSEYYVKPEIAQMYQQQQLHQQQQNNMHMPPQQQLPPPHLPPRKYSFNNNNNPENSFNQYSPRRISNCSLQNTDVTRKFSSCSEGYSSCSELSRRTSSCSSEQSRRTSNCSDYCPCSRRSSVSHGDMMYRRMSQYSGEHQPRKFSSGSMNYEHNCSNGPHHIEGVRRMSMDSNYDRKLSAGSMGSNSSAFEPYRKFSNGFDPLRKLSNTDQYFNGRRISTDSGYDRKMSFSSDYSSSPRSRSNSFMNCQHKNGENVVRTPIGPDGSKGFASRTRKIGAIVVPPV